MRGATEIGAAPAANGERVNKQFRGAHRRLRRHYRLTLSTMCTVTRDGDRLLWGNNVKRELVPESDTMFVIKGNQYRVIFMLSLVVRVRVRSRRSNKQLMSARLKEAYFFTRRPLS